MLLRQCLLMQRLHTSPRRLGWHLALLALTGGVAGAGGSRGAATAATQAGQQGQQAAVLVVLLGLVGLRKVGERDGSEELGGAANVPSHPPTTAEGRWHEGFGGSLSQQPHLNGAAAVKSRQTAALAGLILLQEHAQGRQ